MNSQILETRFNSLEAEMKTLKKQVQARDKQIQTLQDIEDIKRLQCAYGYYLEHWMSDEIIDCFSNSWIASGFVFKVMLNIFRQKGAGYGPYE